MVGRTHSRRPRTAGRARRSGRPLAVVAAMVAVLALIGSLLTGPAGAQSGPSGDAGLAPLILKPSSGIEGAYIVLLSVDPADPSAATEVAAVIAQAEARGANVSARYGSAVVGFAAILDKATVAALRADPRVDLVEQDSLVTKSAEQNNPVWGLDRIDQRNLPLDGVYRYDQDGAGVTVYVADTGIRSTHNDFGGRVIGGTSFIGGSSEDCDGHGTHVAGTVASTTYGVAKAASLWAIRVLNCSGSGSLSGVIAGLDWVHDNATGPSVINMSLGGGRSSAFDRVLTDLYEAEIPVVVSAGNSNGNACNASPASNVHVISVGSTTSSDNRSSFSNWGPCVDLFAPGSSIRSLSHSNDTGTRVLSGTSMAAPHVAGVAALYLGANPNATVDEVVAAVVGGATPGVVNGAINGSPNLLLYSLLVDDPPPPPPPPGRSYPAGVGREVVNGVILKLSGSTLQITGDGDANTVYVTEVDGRVLVGVSDGAGGWDGRSYEASRVRTVKADLKAGDDQFTVGDAANAGEADTINANVIVELNQGQDEADGVPDTTVVGNLTINARGGDNTVDLQDVVVTKQLRSTLQGIGAFVIAGSELRDKATLKFGAGGGTASLTDSSVAKALSLRGANGAEVVELRDLILGATANIALSGGADVLTVDDVMFGARATVDLGSGDNQATTTDTEFGNGFVYRSGGGADVMSFATSFLTRGTGSVNPGSGDDQVTLGFTGGVVRVKTGSGADQATVPASAVASTSLNLAMGSGNDAVDLAVDIAGGVPTVAGFVANGNNGSDTVTVSPTSGGLTDEEVLDPLRLSGFESIVVS